MTKDLEGVLLSWQRDLKGNNTNSYKFVLQLSILHFIENGKYIISFDDLMEYFIKIYWDNCVVYNLIETNNVNQSPSLHKAIISYANENELLGIRYENILKKLNISKKELNIEIVNHIEKGIFIFQNPISRLQNNANIKDKRGNGDPKGTGWLYDWDLNKKTINLKSEVSLILKSNINLFKTLTFSSWTLFIEPFNLSPSLLSKLSRKKSNRSISKKNKELIISISEQKCFYCPTVTGNFDFDHVIPFAYVNHNEPWNIVRSCTNCNRGPNGKFENLPNKTFIVKLKNRNKDFPDLFPDSDNKIKETYENCIKSGFREWKNGEN